jgi:cell division protease FtsH
MPAGDIPSKVSIIPRGKTGGVTWFEPEEEENYHRGLDYFKARLAYGMGGRAAERLVFQQTFAGVEADLKQATRIARYMVTHWGMSDILGPMSFRVGEEHVFLGKELQEARDFSDQTAYLIDQEVQKLLREADDTAYRILSDHRPMLERMVGALLEKEELLKDDIQEICGKRANGLGGSEAPPNGKANTAANSTSIRAQE